MRDFQIKLPNMKIHPIMDVMDVPTCTVCIDFTWSSPMEHGNHFVVVRLCNTKLSLVQHDTFQPFPYPDTIPIPIADVTVRKTLSTVGQNSPRGALNF